MTSGSNPDQLSSAAAAHSQPRKRGRGRRRRTADAGQAGAGGPGGIDQREFAQPVRHTAPVELLSADQIETIHHESLRVLSEIGIKVLHEEARQIMSAHGAELCDDQFVRFAPELINTQIASIPSTFTLHARNPAHSVQFGGDAMMFAMMASAPNSSCLEHGRRTGNAEDYQNFLRLSQMHNIIHVNGGYPVEPIDRHASVRHLDCVHDLITLTDKAYCIYSLGAQRNIDALELTRIAHGLSTDEFRQQPSVFTIINTNSPLQLDIPMMQGIIEMARAGQPSVITPFTLAGAMAPVSIAGALVLQNAEALAGLAFTQMVAPGSPAVYGGFTSNVDMKSGSPAFGTPEYMQAQHAGGQLARYYRIPYRSSNVCAANTVDAQAAYESAFSLWGVVNGGANLVMHAAGWMEGGLCCSYEKIMLDIDMLQMVGEFLRPLDISTDTMAFDAIREVGPGGHFFGTEHTQQRYKTAFYSPLLSDWRNYESWDEAGRPDAMKAANRLWKQRLQQYEQPPLDAAIAEELNDYVSRRKREGGVATDF